MYDELVKLIPLLGILLASVGAFFAYKRTEQNRTVAFQEVKEALPKAVGNGLAEGRGCELITDALGEQTKLLLEMRDDVERPYKRTYDILCDIAETLHKLRHDINNHEANRRADQANRGRHNP